MDIKPHYKENAWIKPDNYQKLYQQSLTHNNQFWTEQALTHLSFIKPFSITQSGPFHEKKWFEDATLNVSEQCIDRHLYEHAHQTAIIWQGEEDSERKRISYQELHDEVCRMANILKKYGIKKGDRVCIYLPMIVEAAYAMLACARIGAVHSVVFAGFSPNALAARINDAECKLLISTANFFRGGKTIPLEHNVQTALESTPCIDNLLMINEPKNSPSINNIQVIDWHKERHDVEPFCHIEEMNAEDPLFILYTSGSTGKPKGLVHTTAGYILYAAVTHKYVFDYHEGDIYWCSADVGWITGHSYIVYGPLANRATTLMFAGTPTYPSPDRFWQIIDKYKVNIVYTAPTAIRSLMKEDEKWLKTTNRKTLRLLGSVGEPINPSVWQWYHDKIGLKNCPVIDTWWQTETGGIMLSPMPGAFPLKPGFVQRPFFGIEPVLVDEKGLTTNNANLLAIRKPWPGMARTIYNDHGRYIENYFKNDLYMTGDGATVDAEGNFQITGRTDDVLNISGHRLGSAEIENALLTHPAVAETAVVSMAHEIKGEAIYAFATLKSHFSPSDALKTELSNTVRQSIGPIATPEHIQWAVELPKTRSGKIMRRLLKKIANKDTEQLGDLSTLASPDIIQTLIAQRQN